jgi:hypothetical protein
MNHSYLSINIDYRPKQYDTLCNVCTLAVIAIAMPVIISLVQFLG